MSSFDSLIQCIALSLESGIFSCVRIGKTLETSGKFLTDDFRPIRRMVIDDYDFKKRWIICLVEDRFKAFREIVLLVTSSDENRNKCV